MIGLKSTNVDEIILDRCSRGGGGGTGKKMNNIINIDWHAEEKEREEKISREEILKG